MEITNGYCTVWTTGISLILHMLWMLNRSASNVAGILNIPLFWSASHFTF